MWFSYRSGSGEKYRIGYATSENGSSWTLDLEEFENRCFKKWMGF